MTVFARCLMVALIIAAPSASAFELDTLLPEDVPGYGTPFGVTNLNRLHRTDNSAGISIGGLNLNPSLAFGTGYDSAPNGAAAGSALLQETPSLVISDTELGLGAFIGGNFQQYPNAPRQNASGDTFAVGERVALPRETITAAAAYLNAQETGFNLTTLALNRPLAFTLADFRASDRISLGLFSVIPDVSLTTYRFGDFASQNRTDTREGLTTEFATGGPGRLVLFLHATQSRYADTSLDADTNEILAGLADDQAGLWNIRLLAGLAQRTASAATSSLTAPVVEASVDWIPDDLDHLRLHLAREIDDPGEVSATPYTLSQARLSLAHEYLRNVIIDLAAEADDAAYIHSPLRETLFSTDMAVDWHLSAKVAMTAAYAFNDRQANYLRAANEHVVTLGVTWTP